MESVRLTKKWHIGTQFIIKNVVLRHLLLGATNRNTISLLYKTEISSK